MKITNAAIKAALKQHCWHMTVNSNWISAGCISKEAREQVKAWVKENLNLEAGSEWYANQSYSVHFDRPQKGGK